MAMCRGRDPQLDTVPNPHPDTNYLARFTAPGKVLIQMGEQIDPDDPWSRAAFATRDVLAAASDAVIEELVAWAVKNIKQ